MFQYHAAFYEGESDWIVAKLLDFPGVLSQGKTLASARRMIRSALQELAESLLQKGEGLPSPNPKAKDKKAIFQEVIPLVIQVPAGLP